MPQSTTRFRHLRTNSGIGHKPKSIVSLPGVAIRLYTWLPAAFIVATRDRYLVLASGDNQGFTCSISLSW
jgi:hypothetical protein